MNTRHPQNARTPDLARRSGNATNSNLNWTYGYDDLDRLTSASTPLQLLGWSYDADGNRLTQTGTAQTLNYPSTSNRLTSMSGTPARSYTYDAAGNITNNGSRAFAYNNRGRMKSTTSGSTTVSYTYNSIEKAAMILSTTIAAISRTVSSAPWNPDSVDSDPCRTGELYGTLKTIFCCSVRDRVAVVCGGCVCVRRARD